MIKRLDIIVDTNMSDEEILIVCKDSFGKTILYKIDNLKAENDEDAIKEMTEL